MRDATTFFSHGNEGLTIRPRRPLELIPLIVFSLLVGPPAIMFSSAAEAAPSLSLSLNQTTFQRGDTLRVGLMAQNPGPAFMADFYFGLLLPDGGTLLFFTSLSPLNLVVSSLANPQTFQPLLANLLIAQGLDVAISDVFVFTFAEEAPPGTYVFFAALTLPGAFLDGQSDAGDLLAIDAKAFSFIPAGARLIKVEGDGQQVVVERALKLGVALRDAQGNPISGIPIIFTILSGSGRLSATAATTDPTGQAATTLTVTGLGAIEVQASAAGLEAVVFSVTGVADTTAPVLTLPSNITAEATAASGRAVSYTATATDAVDGSRPVTCTPASGSTFPLGPTTVTCSASDTRGNTATGSFTVTVVDTTPPVLSLPSNITAEATAASGRAVSYTATATDAVDGSRPVTCTPASGSTFPLGPTTVTCSVSDTRGNTATGSFTVTVVDTT
ncbi:MAG: HYR domain-containing protein, partial [Nitrospinae bacterium]|nr:HYR domain-containing protein [Nitrospinota bacterium]